MGSAITKGRHIFGETKLSAEVAEGFLAWDQHPQYIKSYWISLGNSIILILMGNFMKIQN